MIVDNAIKQFTEKYDREAISSIEYLSEELGLKALGSKINLFNIQESFDKFSKYLEQYSQYKVKYKGDPRESSREVIKESTKMFMDNELFVATEMKYQDLPNFVSAYVEGCQQLITTVESVKSNMRDNEIDLESVGDVTDFADMFMEKMDERFNESMTKILWASGYNTKKRLFGKKSYVPIKQEKEKGHVFL